jgi:hypothetical protein
VRHVTTPCLRWTRKRCKNYILITNYELHSVTILTKSICIYFDPKHLSFRLTLEILHVKCPLYFSSFHKNDNVLQKKCKFHPITGQEGTEGECMCRSALSLTWAQYMGGWLTSQSGRFTPVNDPVLTVQEAGWVTGPVWAGAQNISPAWILSPDCATLTESLYRLTYPAL